MITKTYFNKIASIAIIFMMLFSTAQTTFVSVQIRSDVKQQSGGDGIKRDVKPQTDRVSFIGPENGRANKEF